jgi:hypothetical protein
MIENDRGDQIHISHRGWFGIARYAYSLDCPLTAHKKHIILIALRRLWDWRPG